MTSSFPSIQSFYSREVASDGVNDSSPTTRASAGDGFTSSEVEAVINPLARPFNPSRQYDVCCIAELQTGPHNYKLTGRLVNFSTTGRAEGYYFLVICDGTAAIAVKLYCNSSEYQPLLGQRITVWATSISAGNRSEIQHIPYCSVTTTIYPARNRETHIEFHMDEPGSEEDRMLRRPLEVNVQRYDNLPGLMTLKSFLASGYDFAEGKILVCVRSVGSRRTIHPKKRGGTLDLIEVGLYDDTSFCVLKLWEDKIPSAKLWKPNQTILLISRPWCQVNNNPSQQTDSRFDVGIRYNSIIDVDPIFPDAIWLRTKLQDMAKQAAVITPFPTDTWNLDLAMYGPNRVLYTLAELEDQVRNQNPATAFTGKLSVIVAQIHLMDHWRKTTMYCTDCCGIPLYANKPTATCKHCDVQRDLSLNPRVVGSFLDESGMIAGNKLVWNDTAWTQFLFGAATKDFIPEAVEHSWKAITEFDTMLVRIIEAQLLYSRATLTFGWSIELRRLCILGVEW
ncbi:hypothetical protein F5Y10DRAFT_287479 [Nemania abortiva]|nr:hypothetical protein F5Y10DRAFT_287479 [Nemania abortiva]